MISRLTRFARHRWLACGGGSLLWLLAVGCQSLPQSAHAPTQPPLQSLVVHADAEVYTTSTPPTPPPVPRTTVWKRHPHRVKSPRKLTPPAAHQTDRRTPAWISVASDGLSVDDVFEGHVTQPAPKVLQAGHSVPRPPHQLRAPDLFEGRVAAVALDPPPQGPLTLPPPHEELELPDTGDDYYPPLVPALPPDAICEQPLGEDSLFSVRGDLQTTWPNLQRDTRSLFNWHNAVILGAAGGGAIALRESGADDEVREYTARHPERWGSGSEALGVFGHPMTQVPFIVGVYGTSIWRQDEHLHEFSKSMIGAYTITALSTLAIKGITDTSRPDDDETNGRFGFPSYHTSSSFAIAATIEEYYGWQAGLPAYAFAGLIGWSRIDQRDHDLSDVLFGAVFGYVIGKSVAAVHQEYHSRFQVTPYYDPAAGASGLVFETSF